MMSERNTPMQAFEACFAQAKPIIGMVHLAALPGSPRHSDSPAQIIEQALEEARTLQKGGVDALLLENMHDRPYMKGVAGPEISTLMAVVAKAVKQAFSLPVGLQILAGANREALAAAHAAGLDYIRAEGFVFGHMADEGLIEASAGDMLRYRKQIGADNILVFSDIKKKHSSHAITADVDLADTAHAAEFFLSDGLIVTGSATGREADPEEVRQVKQAVNLPVMVGSGITQANLPVFLEAADALIVGSYFKYDGRWEHTVDYERVAQFMDAAFQLRS